MINIVQSDPMHQIPDVSDVFAEELLNIRNKILVLNPSTKGMALVYTLVYYTIGMCIEYQKQGNGTVPQNIVDSLWNMVAKASKKVFKECEIDWFLDKMRAKFYEKLSEKGIVAETQMMWEQYKF